MLKIPNKMTLLWFSCIKTKKVLKNNLNLKKK